MTSSAMNPDPRSSIQQLLEKPCSSLLANVFQEYPDLEVSCGHRYPHLHRIADIAVEKATYRLGRCYSCQERLSLTIAEQRIAEPGVPLWLTGPWLGYWVRSEEKSPSKGPTDWESFRKKLKNSTVEELEKRDAQEIESAERAVRRLLGSDENPGSPFLPINPSGK